MTGRARGDAGERMAEAHLKALGARIMARNYACRGGEIDIIAELGGILVFVEVKWRGSGRFGSPEEAVDLRKQARICRAALTYMSRSGRLEDGARFDVIAIGPDGLRHIEAAFDYVEPPL